jgi:hypothetical protein
MATREAKRARVKRVKAYYAAAKARNQALQHHREQPLPDRSLAQFNVKRHTIRDSLDQMTLKDIRTMAQDRKIRVDGKRPSLCKREDLIDALVTFYDNLEVSA